MMYNYILILTEFVVVSLNHLIVVFIHHISEYYLTF